MTEVKEEKHVFNKEFADYIASFNKTPGTYSKDELLKIGIKHRELAKDEKNWTLLCSILKINKTPDSFRHWVLKNISALKEPTEIKELTKEAQNNLKQCKQIDLDKTTQNAYKIVTENRDILNAYRKNLRETARLDTFKDLIKSSISNLKGLPNINYKDRLENENKPHTEAVLMLSDLHIGALCNNFYNTYNKEIAQERLNILLNHVIDYCKQNNVEKLNVVNLGDLIQGVIHVNARIEEEIDVVSQVILASEYLATFLNSLQEAAPNIVYRSVTDNHSRLVANLAENIEKENLSHIIDWYVKSRLASTKIVFANDNIDDTIGMFTLSNGKKVAFSHGHLDDINSCFQHFIGATGTYIDYMLLGHYHCEKAKSFQGTKVFVNGSIVGTEQYALSKRLFSEPSQTLLIFEGKDIINTSINLDTK